MRENATYKEQDEKVVRNRRKSEGLHYRKTAIINKRRRLKLGKGTNLGVAGRRTILLNAAEGRVGGEHAAE